MKISTVIFATNLSVEAISLANTPAANEIYEQVLRNKHSSQDNHERLLLEISDIKKTSQNLFDGLEGKNENFEKAVESLKNSIKELDERQQEGILKEKLIEKSLSEIIEKITEKADYNAEAIENSNAEQRELATRLENNLEDISLDLKDDKIEIFEKVEEFEKQLKKLERAQSEFERVTELKLGNFFAEREKSAQLLGSLERKEDEISAQLKVIENFENNTRGKIEAQDVELGMLRKSLQMMQKQMSLDEFREEKIEDKIVKMNLQVLNRMALLENRISEIADRNASEADHEELVKLEEELDVMHHVISYQQESLKTIGDSTSKTVRDLRRTDEILKSSLDNVEDKVEEIGTSVITEFRQGFMKMFTSE
ncbi:Oidioi.mRNA.OKI2018_I69.XSR.g16505.t1.cds [Oikopleura dioica]|uniref:Oidioi.mRNA.OKI2018_I69.XSR.g16505.t1.cds n=1 Tax=Oikopleura dioica TaxID=34765 RepID=A0ABN7SLE8_OIKDI|nr:Oidioi.mRNA.OKI2018_I69.XSR.g16505.t1.cds [Oikopleura dioica]